MLNSDILIENVTGLAASRPERVFAKLVLPENKNIVIGYGDLIQIASKYAALYQNNGVKQNEVVVIIHNDLEQTIYAFVGALLCGAIPSIFAYPSVKISPHEYGRTLSLLLQVCN